MPPERRFTAEDAESAEEGAASVGAASARGIQPGEKPKKNTDEHRELNDEHR
jgi:hypothetical protein